MNILLFFPLLAVKEVYRFYIFHSGIHHNMSDEPHSLSPSMLRRNHKIVAISFQFSSKGT